jgi:hypothetical protein
VIGFSLNLDELRIRLDPRHRGFKPSNEVTGTGRSGGSAAFAPQKLVLTMVPVIAANLKWEG